MGWRQASRWAERTHHKAVDHVGWERLAHWETNDSKPLLVKYCGCCEGRRNSQSHRRVIWKVGLQWSEQALLFAFRPLPHRQCQSAGKKVAPLWWIPKALPTYNMTGAPSTLLVGMQTGEATVENSMEFPQKTKNGTAFWSSHSADGIIP